MDTKRKYWAPTLVLAAIAAATSGCDVFTGQKSAAEEVYVKPGNYDTHYAFLSGGHAGHVYVYGLPSGRILNDIPVFSTYTKTGYGFDEKTKKMMGRFQWGDTHHPAISETKGDYDGRWLFINDNANARIARIDLARFETDEIFGPVPNISGLHGGPYISPNSEYAFAASRFSVPLSPDGNTSEGGNYAPLESYAKNFKGVIAAISLEKGTGHMSLAFEVMMPPIDFDLADSGKGPSEGWTFWSSYNTELAHKSLEVEASQHDQDFITAFNWKVGEQAIKDGKFTMVNGVKMIDPLKVPGIVYFLPTPKSPHGVDVSPDGKYIVGSGKLSPVACVHSFEKFQQAIANKDFDGDFHGIPVVKYSATNVAEVPVGLGPLHTEFDDKGYAYTSLFVDSAITKWQLGTWKVIDKIPVTYNIGHLSAAGGNTMHPDGHYLLALNKLTKDRFLRTGPNPPTNAQLIDISGEKMRLLLDFPTLGEPHYAQIISADKIHPLKIYDLAANHDPWVAHSEKEAGVTRKGSRVDVRLTTIRSHFAPDNIEVQVGDEVHFHVTSLEQDENINHGFAIDFSNVDIEIAPGETKEIIWKAVKAGVVPFYCSNFCSALHQEMQGYIAVKPKKS